MKITKKDLRINKRRNLEVISVSDGTVVLASKDGSVILSGSEKRVLIASFITPEMRKAFDTKVLDRLLKLTSEVPSD